MAKFTVRLLVSALISHLRGAVAVRWGAYHIHSPRPLTGEWVPKYQRPRRHQAESGVSIPVFPCTVDSSDKKIIYTMARASVNTFLQLVEIIRELV